MRSTLSVRLTNFTKVVKLSVGMLRYAQNRYVLHSLSPNSKLHMPMRRSNGEGRCQIVTYKF